MNINKNSIFIIYISFKYDDIIKKFIKTDFEQIKLDSEACYYLKYYEYGNFKSGNYPSFDKKYKLEKISRYSTELKYNESISNLKSYIDSINVLY